MRKTSSLLLTIGLLLGIFSGVQAENLIVPQWKKGQKITNDKYGVYVDEYDIVRDLSTLDKVLKKYYTKYIDYIAPNGKPVRIIAQNKITDEQLLYAYSLLAFYLEDSLMDKKVEIANQMADKKAVIVMPNSADRKSNIPREALRGQPLYQLETPNIGSKWYIENDYEYRDAAFEEIFHLVHDFGIGTTQNPRVDAGTSSLIAKATNNALPSDKALWGKKGLWGSGSADWLVELEEEGSLEQEYIVSVIDSYYGLWEAYTESTGGMWGVYIAKNRGEIATKDPVGFDVIRKILPENITMMMRVDPSFEGTFKIARDTNETYTYKSQYLQNISLTGNKNTNILGNSLDNIFMGNGGNNLINGVRGRNIVQFRGKSTEYKIATTDAYTEVTDSIGKRDGKDTLYNITVLRFTDKDIII